MKLFEEFEKISTEQWEKQILKDLKIESLNELVWHNDEDFDIKPFYNTPIKNFSSDIQNSEFDIIQFVPLAHSDEERNEVIIKALNGGASGIFLEIEKTTNYAVLFKNVSLPHIYTQLQLSYDASDVLDLFTDIQTDCFVNIDPIFLYEKNGTWNKDLSVLYRLKHIPVNGTLYHEAGGNIIQQLAFITAHLNEYLLYLETEKKLNDKKIIHLTVSVGGSFFREIAKIRALRVLVGILCKEYHINPHIHIHAQTSLTNKSHLDIYNNLIRTSTESMSAILGGANSIHIYPFDYPFKKCSDFSLRMARNQLLIHKHESFLNKVIDTSKGSYFIEHLTEQYITLAYQKFLSIEKSNGFIHELEQKTIQNEINTSAQVAINNFNSEKSTLVGVNKYPNQTNEDISSFHYKNEMPQSSSLFSSIRLATHFETK